MQAGFKRFQIPHTSEMHQDDLEELLRFVGYPAADSAETRRIAAEVTPYNEMDGNELLSFAERYARRERERRAAHFEAACAAGGSAASTALAARGLLPAGELRNLLVSLDYMPLNDRVQEALSEMGMEKDSNLSMEDFLRFLTAYRRTEGFTELEVLHLRGSFDDFQQAGTGLVRAGASGASAGSSGAAARGPGAAAVAGVPAGSIVEALVHALGPTAESPATRVAGRMGGGDGLAGSPGSQSWSFSEFLALARRVREVQNEDRAPAFARFAQDGRVPAAALQALMRSLGYEPLQAVVTEVLQALNLSEQSRLDFNDFFHFVLAFDAQHGLPRTELEHLESAFKKHDTKGTGSINVGELANIMRQMGHNLSNDDFHALQDRMGLERSGSLRLTEFIRLVAAHDVGVLKRLRTAFREYKVKEGGKSFIPEDRLVDALESVVDGPLTKAQQKMVEQYLLPPGADFDSFVELAAAARRAGAEVRRRHAGFTQRDLNQFHTLFERCVPEGRRTIDIKDLQGLLINLGIKARTKDEMRAVKGRLDEARAAARLAGVQGVSSDGKDELGYWELVQLMRLLRSDSDKAAGELLEKEAQDLGFTSQESEQFRKIFVKWSRQDGDSQFDKSNSSERRSGGSGPGPGAADGADGFGTGEEPPEEGLSSESLYRLLRSMGMSMTFQQKKELEAQARALEPSAGGGVLSLVGFLKMMRWLLDTDFAGINGAAATIVRRKGAIVPNRTKELLS